MAADWHIRPQPSSPPEVNDSRAPHCGLSSVQSGCRSWVRFDYWTYSHFWHPHVRGGGVNMALTRFRKSLIWLISRRYISWKFEIELPQHERNPNRLSVDETGRRTRRETNGLQDGQTSFVHPFAHLSIYLPIRVILKISFDHMKLTQDSDAYIDSYHLRTVLPSHTKTLFYYKMSDYDLSLLCIRFYAMIEFLSLRAGKPSINH